ncbi:DUF3293 domain-containing protein [Pseudoalteromonas sp. GB56]
MFQNPVSHAILDAYLDPYFLMSKPIAKYTGGCVITACNPNGIAVGKRKNAVRTALLHHSQRRWQLITGYGGNKVMSYREFSVFLRVSRVQAIRLMRRFNQNGVYYFNKGKIELLLSDGRSFQLVGRAKAEY